MGGAAHAAPQLRYPSAGAKHRHSRDSGLARACQARHDGALHPGGHQPHSRSHESAGPAHAARTKENSRSANDVAGLHGPPSSGGRGHLPRPRGRVASRQPPPRDPRPAQGDERHRELPHGSPWRPCGTLRGLRPYNDRLQQLPQSALPQMPGRGRARMDGGARGRAAPGALFPCRLYAAGGDRRHRLPQQGHDLRSSVHGRGTDDAYYRGGSQASRRPHRHHFGVAQLGLGNDASSACPHDRARRRPSQGWKPLGPSKPNFCLPVRVLSKLFRRLMLTKLAAAHAAGKLQFFGAHAHLAAAKAFAGFLASLRKTRWFVYAKRPFAGPKTVLAYLSRYTHRVAISNRRLIALDERSVTFKVKDYRIDGPGRYTTMTLDVGEFIRRFLIHVLPKGFHRIRHYGLLAGSNRAETVGRAGGA